MEEDGEHVGELQQPAKDGGSGEEAGEEYGCVFVTRTSSNEGTPSHYFQAFT